MESDLRNKKRFDEIVLFQRHFATSTWSSNGTGTLAGINQHIYLITSQKAYNNLIQATTKPILFSANTNNTSSFVQFIIQTASIRKVKSPVRNGKLPVVNETLTSLRETFCFLTTSSPFTSSLPLRVQFTIEHHHGQTTQRSLWSWSHPARQ